MDFTDTLRNTAWLEANRPALVGIFPETWTHAANVDFQVALGFRLKLLGLDFRSTPDLAECLAELEKRRILLRDGLLLLRGKLNSTN